MKTRQKIPPSYAQQLLLKFLRKDLAEEVLGDLEEQFGHSLKNRSLFRARINYWFQVLNYLRPFAIRKSRSRQTNAITMLRHNLLLSVRTSQRYKSSFLINLTGLAAGLACTVLIYLWVADELRVDKFHEHNDRLYRVMSNHTDASGIFTWTGVPGLLLEEIETTVPDASHAVASSRVAELVIATPDKKIKAPGQFSSNDFFQAFSYPLILGDKTTVLNAKNNIVLSRSLSERLFDQSALAIGKTVEIDLPGKPASFVVTGVFEDVGTNSSQKFDFVGSWQFYHDEMVTYKNWYNYYCTIDVVLKDGAAANDVSGKIDAILKKNQGGSEKVDLFLTSFSGLYLYSKYENGREAGGRVVYVKLFSVIAVFILVIACINFMNLATARASRRTKEVGIKKALGARRTSLAGQYFVESLMITLMGLLTALGVVKLILPQFNLLTGKELSLTFDANLIIALVAVTVITGLIAGSYPALYLSSFNPVSIFRGKLAVNFGEAVARKGLVIFQFAISIILIVAVVVVYKQIEFVQSRNLGYDRDNLIYFPQEGKIASGREAFLNEVKNIPGVVNAGPGAFSVDRISSTGGIDWEGKTEKDQVQFDEVYVGYDVIEMLGLQIVDGRSFSREFSADTAAIVFNETAIAAMGMESPVGKVITHYTGPMKIIGVVKDFNMGSLHKKVGPAHFIYKPEWSRNILVKIESGKETEVIQALQKLFATFNPGYAFDYRFVDDDYQTLYSAEQRVASLSQYFAGIAILISSLGLFGLAAFTAERRSKEIAIRKVLGSSELGIVYLLSVDFTKMVAVAIAIGIPISYFAAEAWLSTFAYKIDLAWWYFGVAGVVALVIAWLTVGLQTVKAAAMNPADSLKID